MAEDEDFYRRYWDTADDEQNSEQRNQEKEYRAILDLINRIRDLEFRIQWHEKSKEGDNGLSNTFNQFVLTEQAMLDDLKLELEQCRSAYEKRYGISLQINKGD